MLARHLRSSFRFQASLIFLVLLAANVPAVSPARSEDKRRDTPAEPVTQGQRVFSCGHSFHVFVPGILSDMAKAAGIQDHQALGLSAIGGSRVIQHWDVSDDKNKAKEALRSGNVDVLTLSPIHLPDEGIEKFARLALEHNPKIRVTVQEFWLDVNASGQATQSTQDGGTLTFGDNMFTWEEQYAAAQARPCAQQLNGPGSPNPPEVS